MKKLFLTLVLVILFTSTANAETMYLKEQAWSYSSPKLIPDIAVSVYGKDERVEVLDTETVMMPVWVPTLHSYMYKDEDCKMCLVEKNGVKAYLPRSVLSTKKPKYTYRIKNCYKKITIAKGGRLYSSPTFSSRSLTLENDLTLYTLGQTNYWYEVYHNGNVYFIKKQSKDIISDEPSVFPTIYLDGVSENCVDRVMYMYSLLPQRIRDDVYVNSITVSDWEDRKQTIMGHIYMDKGIISVREDEASILEYSLLHEIGHAYMWKHGIYDGNIYEERHNLKLSVYHLNFDEFYAEGLDLYVRQYDYLQKQAPGLFKYYDSPDY